MTHPPHCHTRSRGFSLVELLVVISIAAILLALSVPSVRGLLLQGQISSNSTAISAAADTARRLAKSRAVQVGYPEGAQYQGVAMVVTPSNEIRMVVSEPDARQSALGLSAPRFLSSSTQPSQRWSGFADIEDFDYIPLTEGADIYGIDYDEDAGGMIFLPPPFAVRFDPQGRLVVSSITSLGSDTSGPNSEVAPWILRHAETQDRLVVYSRYDNGTSGQPYETSNNDRDKALGGIFDPRTTPYAPENWTPTWSPTAERFDLPFGVLEAVGAVRIVQPGESPVNPESDYTDLIFSRYSGSPTRIQQR